MHLPKRDSHVNSHTGSVVWTPPGWWVLERTINGASYGVQTQIQPVSSESDVKNYEAVIQQLQAMKFSEPAMQQFVALSKSFLDEMKKIWQSKFAPNHGNENQSAAGVQQNGGVEGGQPGQEVAIELPAAEELLTQVI